ncbi:MAG: ABC transporter permease [Microbacteriaceae bacterium]|nr:ABC transporter permease [Microbacteriaceae bacterium]
MNRVKGLVKKPPFWGFVAILLLLAINLAKDPRYLAITVSPVTGNLVGNVIDILRVVAPILLIAFGMCLVIATGGIDLSVGSVMAVSGAVAMQYLHDHGAPDSVGDALAAIGLALGVALLVGLVNAVLVAVVGLQPFITTLVMMLAGRGLAKVVTQGQNTNAVNDPMRWIANGYVLGIPVVFLLALVLIVVVAVLIRRSALGLLIESLGVDPKAARLAGVDRRALLFSAYLLSALLAGIAGLFATGSVMTVDVSQTGYQAELDAILAVVVGGTSLAGGRFSLGGAVVGAFLIATLDKTIVFLGVPASATPAFKAVVIVVLCLLQSQRVRGWIGQAGARMRAARKAVA